MRTRRPTMVTRAVDRFLEDPSSVRKAVRLIITLTLVAVLLGSVVMWIFDPRDFPDLGTALWFTLQTVTTVGYGDVAPTSWIGRVVAGIVMLMAIAFLSIVTALVTSTFIDAAQRRRVADQTVEERAESDRVEARIEEVLGRLAVIEQTLMRLESRGPESDTRAGPVGTD
jgi:voltage-gated potassium channel